MLSQPWRIELLGSLQARQGERSLSRFRTRKIGALLGYLALHRAQLHPREQIAGILWPESDEEAARASLRTALASLRQQLEPHGTPANSILIADRVHVGLNPQAITTDVADFEAALQTAREAPVEAALQADLTAVDLYRGELLDGYYEEWIFAERERLARQYGAALARLTATFERSGDLDRAIEFAQRSIEIDCTDEEAHLRLMRLYQGAGRPEAALRQFRRLERHLQEELGLAPSAPLQAIVQELINAPRAALRPARTSSEVKTAPTTSESAPSRAPARLSQPATDLPLPLTKFFGRETEIAQLVEMFSPADDARDRRSGGPVRLVTLTGPGGTGKTRLAIEVATRLAESQPGAVTFAPLADLFEARRLPEAIADALHLSRSAGPDPLQTIVEALTGRTHTLVLDNFEQLLTTPDSAGQTAEIEAVEIVNDLLRRSPQLSILLTSRQRLDLEGERDFAVSPLPTPARPGTPERLLEFASVQLFVDRALAVRSDFQLKPQNVEAVGALCAKLEGIPLALELAAAWSHLLSPAQMLSRLETRHDLLVSKRKGVAARHQTLHAAIDWSYRLLPPPLQRLFAQMSVFCGGWTLEAAEAVGEGPDVMGMLQSLLDRSMLVSDEVEVGGDLQMRYRMLEALRDFAADQLTDEERIALRQRHLAWCVQWMKGIQRHSLVTEQIVWLQKVESELENVRAALHWSLADEQGCLAGLELIGSLEHFWCLRGNYDEVRSLLDRLLAQPAAQEPTQVRARSLSLAGMIAYFQKDWNAAQLYYEECLNIAQACAHVRLVTVALMSLGNIAMDLGDLDTSRRYFTESMREYEAAGSILGVAAANGAFGLLAMEQGDLESALLFLERAVALQRQEKNLSGVTYHLMQLALLYARIGEAEHMRLCLFESIEGYIELKDGRGLAELFSHIAQLAPPSEATVRLMAAAQALNAAVAAAPFQLDSAIANAQTSLGATAFQRAWSQGAAFSVAQALDEARTLLAPPTSSDPAASRPSNK